MYLRLCTLSRSIIRTVVHSAGSGAENQAINNMTLTQHSFLVLPINNNNNIYLSPSHPGTHVNLNCSIREGPWLFHCRKAEETAHRDQKQSKGKGLAIIHSASVGIESIIILAETKQKV